MSYIRDMNITDIPTKLTVQLGKMLREARVKLGWTQAEAAARAGIRRQKLIEIEQGRPGVAMGLYAAAMAALDLEPTVRAPMVTIDDYPQLRRLVWNQPGARTLTEQDALALYERNWALVDTAALDAHERDLLQNLVAKHGNGVLHV